MNKWRRKQRTLSPKNQLQTTSIQKHVETSRQDILSTTDSTEATKKGEDLETPNPPSDRRCEGSTFYLPSDRDKQTAAHAHT